MSRVLPNLRLNCRGERSWNLGGASGPVLDRIVHNGELVGCPLVFVAASPARKIGLCTFYTLDNAVTLRFKIRPLLALGNQPHGLTELMAAKLSSQPRIAQKFDAALPEQVLRTHRVVHGGDVSCHIGRRPPFG